MLDANQETTLPLGGDRRVLVHSIGQLATGGYKSLSAGRSINICPEKGFLILFKQIFVVKYQRTCLLIIHTIQVHDVQDQLTAHNRHAHWDEERRVPRGLILMCFLDLSTNCLATDLCSDEGVHRVLTDHIDIEFGQMLTFYDVHLVLGVLWLE